MENFENGYQKTKKWLFKLLIGTLLFNIVLLCLVILLDGKIWFGVFYAVFAAGLYCLFGLITYLVLLIKEPKNNQNQKNNQTQLFGTLILFLRGIAFSFFNLIVIILTNL